MFFKKKGASVTELGLLAGLIAVLLIAAINQTGNRVGALFAITGERLNGVVIGDLSTVDPEDAIHSTCLSWYQAGKTQSGVYQLDPDGEAGPLASVPIFCDMNNSTLADAGLSAHGWMQISNNREANSGVNNSCASTSCKVFDVEYYDASGAILPEVTMKALMDQSGTIAQNFYKSCHRSIVTKEYGGGGSHQENASIPIGASTRTSFSRAAHFDNEVPDCDTQNEVSVLTEEDRLFVNKLDITPIKSLYGGDADEASEYNFYRIGKAYLR